MGVVLFYTLDKAGRPVPSHLKAWSRWFAAADKERVVASTEIGDVHVSTVFLGVDHGHGVHHKPVLWETMIFGWREEYQRRYASLEDARAGHEAAVRLVKGGR